jgi:hypothetical protein
MARAQLDQTAYHRVLNRAVWSSLAVSRVLLGLFSFVTLLAHDLSASAPPPVQRAAWYPKTAPAFADALALVRRHLWTQTRFACRSRPPTCHKCPGCWRSAWPTCSATPLERAKV